MDENRGGGDCLWKTMGEELGNAAKLLKMGPGLIRIFEVRLKKSKMS